MGLLQIFCIVSLVKKFSGVLANCTSVYNALHLPRETKYYQKQ